MTYSHEQLDITSLVTEIVSSYISNHEINTEDLPSLIKLIHQSLHKISSTQSSALAAPTEPAVPIKDSLTPDYLICLEDGRRVTMLKRHLKTAYNLTPDQYRERWGLPENYPMVAPNYAKHRSNIAKNIGLGKHTSRKSKTAA